MSAGQVAAAVAAALIAGGAVRRRGRLGTEWTVAALLLALGLGVYASGVLSGLPDPKEVIGDVARTLGDWTYLLVGAMAFLETGAFVGLVAPGETAVIAGGVIAGQGEIELIPLIGLVWACALLGDSTSFLIGQRLGRGFLERHGPRVKITPERLEQVERYFQRHGGKTILIGRFIGLVRALAPFIAGSSGLPYRSFVPFSIVGTGVWATFFSVLGFVFWRSFDQVARIAGQAAFGFGLTVGAIAAAVLGYRHRRAIADWLRRHREHPLLRAALAVGRPLHRALVRPVARVVGPPVRFAWNRLTPGGLGLELTSTIAAAGVGAYLFLLHLTIVSGGAAPTTFDREGLELADDLRSAPVVDVARVVTDLGSFPVAAALVAVTMALLAVRRRPSELIVLGLGFALVVLTVDAVKEAVDRARPPGSLVETGTAAYPSGHAAYSIAWVAVALVVTRRLGLAGHAALVAGAIVLAAAIGLSRVYLRAHYWSDVVGGWGLAIGILATLAAAALVVDHIRNNGNGRMSQPAAARRR